MSYFIGNHMLAGVVILLLILHTTTVHGVIPTSCGKSYCERSNDYPISQTFQRMMENDPRFAALKGATVPKSSSSMADDDPNLPPDDVQYQICKSKSDTIFPQEAQNTRGQRKFIINFGPFQQGIFIERCTTDSFRQQCSYIGTPPNYQTVCIQKEIEHRLTTIESDPVTGSVSTSVDIFRFPSYCACKLVPGQRNTSGALCAASSMPQPPIIYGPVSYGADDSGSERKSARILPGTISGRTTTPLPSQQQRQGSLLGGRTLDLFGK